MSAPKEVLAGETAATLRLVTRRRIDAEQDWRDEIRNARARGMSLRAIAACVGVAHTRVLEITREQ